MNYEDDGYDPQITRRRNNSRKPVRSDSYRLNATNQHGVKSYDVGKYTTIKSPELLMGTLDVDVVNDDFSSPSQNKKKSPFTLYQTVSTTPKLSPNPEQDEFMMKLGRRSDYGQRSGNSRSTVNSSPQASEYSSSSERSKYLSPKAGDRINTEYQKYYVPRNISQKPQSDESEVIRLLRMQIDEQRKLIEVFMEKEKKKETPLRSEKKEKQKATYTIPESESPQKEKKIKTPDYESMDVEDIEKYEAKFRGLFATLREKYPRWGIEVPKIGEISLRTVHEIYEEIINTIVIYQNAMKYKVFLVLAFAAIEYYFYKVKKIRAFKNFTKVQIKSLPKYHVYLLNLSKTLHESGGEEWPSWMNFISNIVTSLLSFISIQGAANAMGWSAPESILHEADKFISPDHGPAKLKHDGISEIPAVPSGWQDPNVIIDRGTRLWETVEEINDISNQEEVPISKAKPINVGKYDDVFE